MNKFDVMPTPSAVTLGRFNVCTTAHLNAFSSMAKQFNRLEVCVIDDTLDDSAIAPNPEYSEFYSLADAQQTKTTITLSERLELMRRSVTELTDCTIHVRTARRPEYYPSEFNALYPKHSHQLTFSDVSPGQLQSFESIRNVYLPRILERTIHLVPVDFILHVSDIRKAAISDPSVWKKYISPKAYDFFISIDGPSRV